MFIEKGFRGTTIAGIAEAAGIAKGSVYSYFTSKLDIVKALFLQSDEKNQIRVEQLLCDKSIKHQDLLERYLSSEFQEVLNERSFIQVFLSDEMIIMDPDVMTVIQECRVNYHISQQKVLMHTYGKIITPWMYDTVSLVNGLLQEYSVYLTLDEANFSIKRCAHFIAYCVENSVNALVKSSLSPLLTQDNFPLTQDVNLEKFQRQKTKDILTKLKSQAELFNNEQQSLILETIELIELELDKPKISDTLIRALIANLRPYSDLNNLRRRLAESLDIELI
jgi:hypothetical protein